METVVRRIFLDIAEIEEIADRISTGDSILIIGPRHGGKGWLTRRLFNILHDERALSPVQVKFAPDVPADEGTAVAMIRDQLGVSSLSSLADFQAYIRKESVRLNRPILLFLANIDGLEREVARKLLRLLRVGIHAPQRWLTAVVTGESDIRSLVTGPDSEFNCAYEFIVQGMGQSLFEVQLQHWCEVLQIQISEPAITYSRIWSLSGGNFSVVRRWLHSRVDRAIAKGTSGTLPNEINPSEIEQDFRQLLSLGAYGAAFFQRAGELITSASPDPECSLLLTKLLEGEQPAVPMTPPTVLELAGVAIFKDGHLHFSSPLMKQFIQRNFGFRRRGDLEAFIGNFGLAFRYYAMDGSPSSVRPTNLQDQLVVSAVIRRLIGDLPNHGLEQLNDLVQSAIELILGFSNIVRLTWVDDHWNTLSSSTPVPPEIQRLIEQMVALTESVRHIGQDETHAHGFLATFVHYSAGRVAPGGLLVWEPIGHTINPIRSALLQEILNAFVGSHSSRWDQHITEARERLATHLNAIAIDVVSHLFIQLTDPGDVLQATGKRLVEHRGYFTRAAFLISEPNTEDFELVLCEPPMNFHFDTTVARKLFASENVVVLPLRILFSVDPAEGGQLCLGISVGQSGGLRLVLVLEIGEQLQPPEAFADTVRVFGNHLKAALEQSQRIALLSKALNRIADPVMLFDAQCRHVYANEPAKKLLGLTDLQKEWRIEPRELDPGAYRDLLQYIEQTRLEQRRIATFIERIAGRPYQGIVVSDVLRYKDNKVTGILVHIPDQQYYAEMLRALQVLDEATNEDSALERLAEIFRQQGHGWIRMYLVEDDRLRPYKCIDDRSEVMQNFHQLALPTRDPNSPSWAVIFRGTPQVFCFSEASERNTFYTARGLLVTRVPDPPQRTLLGKKIGDFWIDVPLIMGRTVVGKLSIPCDEQLSPERLEMLRVFAGVAGRALEGIRNRKFLDEQNVRIAIQERTKQVSEKLAPLSVLLVAVSEAERHAPSDVKMALQDLRRDLHTVFEDVLHSVKPA